MAISEQKINKWPKPIDMSYCWMCCSLHEEGVIDDEEYAIEGGLCITVVVLRHTRHTVEAIG